MNWQQQLGSPPRAGSSALLCSAMRALLASFTILLGACTQFPASSSKQEIPPNDEKVGDLRVQVDAATKTLSNGQVAETKADSLLPDVRELLHQQRAGSARAFVLRRPDMALETLRGRIGQNDDKAALAAIATAYDEQMHLPRGGGWSPLVEASQDKAVRCYSEARKHMHDALRQGASLENASTELTQAAAATGSPMIALDQLNLCGIAALIAEQPRHAVAYFEQACQLATKADPYQEVQLALLLSDALRRAGETEQANRVWVSGVTNAGKLAQNAGMFDPVYWDRASYLRPVSVAWPSDVLIPLANRAKLSVRHPIEQLGAGEGEAIVWGAISQGLLERGDHQAALVAAKRAEVATLDVEVRSWLRLTQAEALACLDQIPAATAILIGLTTSRDAQLADAATATLGGLKLRSGDANTGFRLLVKALNQQSPPEWPGRANAEADLGLAYLMRNDEQNGLKWLHSAQSRFSNVGNVLGLSQSLRNEAAYLKQAKHKSEELEVQNRLASIELNQSNQRR